jgi:hypothetical protein
MMRFVHLFLVILVVSAVGAGLKTDGGKAFSREFGKSAASLFALYAGLGVVFFAIAWAVGHAG